MTAGNRGDGATRDSHCRTPDVLGLPYLRKPFQLDDLLVECAATIVERKQNLVLVRAALDRLLSNQEELVRLIGRAWHFIDAPKERHADTKA